MKQQSEMSLPAGKILPPELVLNWPVALEK